MAAAKLNALSLVLDLTHRLATDYGALPLDVITSCVQGATSAVRLFGEDLAEAIATVETLARADLTAIESEAAFAHTPTALAS